MEALQHDPRTKQQIKDLLYDHLYLPVQVAYRKRLKNIILENCKLQNTSHPSMIYRGEVYIAEDSITPPPRRVPSLHESLKPMMDEYLSETAYLNSHELPYVLGYINQVLNASNDIPDYLRLLPDSVHKPIQKLLTSCPCKTVQLSDETVQEMRERNQVSIELMKQRLTLNLLL